MQYCIFLFCQIFTLAYGTSFVKTNEQPARQLFTEFANALQRTYPELLKKPKVHILHHLVDDIVNLGPANGFCTER